MNAVVKLDPPNSDRKENTSLRRGNRILKAQMIRVIEEGINVQKILEKLICDHLNKGK